MRAPRTDTVKDTWEPAPDTRYGSQLSPSQLDPLIRKRLQLPQGGVVDTTITAGTSDVRH